MDHFLRMSLEFDGWSTAKAIERCANLTDGELSRETGIGRSSILAALAHLSGSYGMFAAVLAGEPLQPGQPQDTPGPKVMLESFNASHARFTELSLQMDAEDKLDETVTIPWNRAVVSKRAWVFIALDHSAYHRAELEIMLASLGLEAFPGVSASKWAEGR